MTTIASIAQRILDENGYSLTDFSGLTLTILEYKIDDAIDYVNAEAGTSIAALTGTAETKSFTYTAPENLAVKGLVNLMLRAFKEKGEQVGISSLSVTYLQSDPDFRLSMQVVDRTIERLKMPPICIENEPVPTSE
jgi:hypothetical protein